jgi:hypothetical protein
MKTKTSKSFTGSNLPNPKPHSQAAHWNKNPAETQIKKPFRKNTQEETSGSIEDHKEERSHLPTIPTTIALMMCRGIDVGCLSWLWPPPTPAFLAQFRAAAPRDAMTKENLPNPLQQKTTSSGLLVSRETRIEIQIRNYNHIILLLLVPSAPRYTKNSARSYPGKNKTKRAHNTTRN